MRTGSSPALSTSSSAVRSVGFFSKSVTDRLIDCERFGGRCRFLRSRHQPERSECQSQLDCSSVSFHHAAILNPFVYPNAVMSRNPDRKLTGGGYGSGNLTPRRSATTSGTSGD